MLKTFAMIVRRPDVDRDAFRKHYEEIHSPLALPLLEGLVRYVKYHVTDELHGEAGFDVISSFWYTSAAAAGATVARVEGPEGEAIRADEQTFMDKAKNTFVVVAEQTPESERGPEGAEGSEQCFVLVKAGANDREPSLDAFDARAWGGLEEAFGGAAYASPHRVLGDASTPYDRVMQLRPAAPFEPASVVRWAAHEASHGTRVVAVRTRLYETETPWFFEDASAARPGNRDTVPGRD